MPFEIAYASQAVKQLKKLDKIIQAQMLKRLEKLAENPFLAKPLSNEFKNFRSEHVGKYRVIFSIKDKTLIIAAIKHRKDAYE
ncbi:type II toxin-antitoxin system RelE/ParE family toxin [archaeon]|nr:type II toxin-antitoxin system RelE/ParE family toxin [archaeon]